MPGQQQQTRVVAAAHPATPRSAPSRRARPSGTPSPLWRAPSVPSGPARTNMEQSSVNVRERLRKLKQRREKSHRALAAQSCAPPRSNVSDQQVWRTIAPRGRAALNRNFGLTTCSTTLRRLVDRLLQRNSDAGMMSKCDGAD